MSKKHYIAITQTIDPTNGMTYLVGFLGVFHDLKKALAVCNQELKRMKAPDYYELLPFRRISGVVPTDENGNYVEDNEKFGIIFDVIEAESDQKYSLGDSVYPTEGAN